MLVTICFLVQSWLSVYIKPAVWMWLSTWVSMRVTLFNWTGCSRHLQIQCDECVCFDLVYEKASDDHIDFCKLVLFQKSLGYSSAKYWYLGMQKKLWHKNSKYIELCCQVKRCSLKCKDGGMWQWSLWFDQNCVLLATAAANTYQLFQQKWSNHCDSLLEQKDNWYPWQCVMIQFMNCAKMLWCRRKHKKENT